MLVVHVKSALGVSGLANSLTFILNIFSWQPISFPYWLSSRHTQQAGSPEESHGKNVGKKQKRKKGWMIAEAQR